MKKITIGTGAFVVAALSLSSVLTASAAVTVSVNPLWINVPVSQSQQFSATVSGTTNTSAVWYVNGIKGGNSTVGTISSSGVYRAPANPVTTYVTAKSAAASSASATATVWVQTGVVLNVYPEVSTVPPGAALQLTSAITGTTNTQALWHILGSGIGSVSQTGLYTAPATVSSTMTVSVVAQSVADTSKTDTVQITVVAGSAGSTGGVTVSVTPKTQNLEAGQTQQFTATVAGTNNTSVNWSVSPSVGTISASGLYSPSAAVSTQQTVTVKATSAASPSASASASVVLYPPVAITTTSVPGGTLGVSYSTTVNASGGMAPYSWKVASGSVPTGLSLTSSGTLSGTPTATGSFSFTATATDSLGRSASQALTMSVSAPSSLGITTSSLPTAIIQQPYQATLSASSGSGPYTWTIKSGSLPPGISLNSTTGQLSGTPTQGGQFLVTFQVATSGGSGSAGLTLQVFEQSQDAYSGLTAKPCPKGPQPRFYTQKISGRWHLCTPAGNAFWMNGVYDVDASDTGADYQNIVLANVVNTKYGSGFTNNSTLNWSLQSVRRLQSWGFNTLAEYATAWTLPVAVNSSWPTSDNTIPLKLPFVGLATPTYYSMSNSGGYASGPVKDLMAGVKTSVYNGYRSSAADYWDPNFAQYFQKELTQDYWIPQWLNGPHNQYLVSMVVDDTDYLQGFGAGPDFPTIANNVVSPGYGQPHLGWIILVTAPTQTSNSSFGVTYTDTTVYSKKQFSTWLSARYGGSIASLNAAWGSKYTTFGTAGGWGVGTGLLDEDGTCPAKGSGACWVPTDSFQLQGATATMQADLDAFLLAHAQRYFSTVKGILQAAAPGVLYGGPTTVGTWGAPPRRQILQAASAYVDVLGVATLPSMCNNCTDIQQRVDFVAQYAGDKPWISWEGYWAQADSYMSVYPAPSDPFTTQLARGQAYQQRITALLNSADSTTGTYHLVGLKWWSMYDNRGESANWGLVTPRDDPYDGVSATTHTGADGWGYPTGCLAAFGCEWQSYGNFLTSVTNANFGALQTIATTP